MAKHARKVIFSSSVARVVPRASTTVDVVRSGERRGVCRSDRGGLKCATYYEINYSSLKERERERLEEYVLEDLIGPVDSR